MATSILMQRNLLKAACLSSPDLKPWITWLELSLPRLPVMITTPNTPWQTVMIDFHSAPVHLSLIPMKGAQPQKASHTQPALHLYTVCTHRTANLNPSHLSQTQMFYSALQMTCLEVSSIKMNNLMCYSHGRGMHPYGNLPYIITGCLLLCATHLHPLIIPSLKPQYMGESSAYWPLSGWRSTSWSPA